MNMNYLLSQIYSTANCFTVQYTLMCVCPVGHLFSWGCNSAGQLGIGLPVVSNTNISGRSKHADSGGLTLSLVHRVDSLRGVAIAQIAAGAHHSTALSVSGALFTWGFNRYALILMHYYFFFILLLLLLFFNIIFLNPHKNEGGKKLRKVQRGLKWKN